jgi:putative SOS response-associated peptidase YedK
MCGRYVLKATGQELVTRYDVPGDQAQMFEKPRFNVAPGQFNPVITNDGKNRLELMKWGLIPSWSKEPKMNFSTINARSETLLEKPTYRKPFRTQRCLIPATGFYEWYEPESNVKRPPKTPYYFYLHDGKNKNEETLFSFAGLYDVWRDKEGEELKSYTIVNTAANSLMAKVHPRMPIILPREAEKIWLDPAVKDDETLLKLLQPYSADLMEMYQISTEVNKVNNDSPNLILPVAPTPMQASF